MEGVLSINLIAADPAVRNGRPFIAGTTVTVADIVIAHVYQRMDADTIADWFGLSLAQTHVALAWYYSHQAETDALVRQLIRRADAFVRERPGNEGTRLPR